MSKTTAESVFREVNDRIREVSSGWVETEEPLGFLCECGDTTCTETVPLALAEYDALRATDSHVLVAGHLAPFVLTA